MVIKYSGKSKLEMKRLYFALQFQRDRVHNGSGSMIEGAGSRLITFHSHTESSREKTGSRLRLYKFKVLSQ